VIHTERKKGGGRGKMGKRASIRNFLGGWLTFAGLREKKGARLDDTDHGRL